jgi:hypothetical protein
MIWNFTVHFSFDIFWVISGELFLGANLGDMDELYTIASLDWQSCSLYEFYLLSFTRDGGPGQ